MAIDVMARAHEVAHTKLRKGMCLCGACPKCKHRACVAQSRVREPFYEQHLLSPEMTQLFPIFAEELASILRCIRRRK